jgi:ABC-type multidrug transport system ATPase subunit
MTATLPPRGSVVSQAERGMLLKAFGICVDRGGQRLLDGIDLQLDPGEFVGVLAPSGGGKTTLLKRLAGFTVPPATQGRITFDGRLLDAESIALYRRRVGFVPQDDLLYRNLTGRENLTYAARLRWAGRPGAIDIDTAVAQTIDRLGLSAEEADRPVSKLSGGQRRRLSVGLELLGQPGLLLLDEPTAGLDPATETRVMRLLRDIARAGTTVACATHVLDNLNLFDQVIVLADRRVDFVGSPALLLAHYQVQTFTELYERIEAKGTGQGRHADAGGQIQGSDSCVEFIDQEASGNGSLNNATSMLRRWLSAQAAESRPPDAGPLPTPPTAGAFRQVSALTSRGLLNLVRDRRWLVLLFASPVLIAGLINLSQVKPLSGLLPLTFAVVAAIWFGLTNSVREVVRDRRFYIRERLLGVRPCAYLTAKGVVFGLVGLVQVAALWAVIRHANVLAPDHPALLDLQGWAFGGVLAVLWGCYLAALCLGLLISTLATTEEWAVAMLPLAILPQLLLTAVATNAAGSDPDLAPQEWFYPLGPTCAILAEGPAAEAVSDDLGGVVVKIADWSGAPEEQAGGKTTADSPHRDWRWWVEGASMLTYSRPGLDVLHLCWRTPKARTGERWWDVAHLVGDIVLTAGAVWFAFRWREKHWLRQAS